MLGRMPPISAREAIRSVGVREAIRWHARAWGDALRPALRYPISGREQRQLVIDATRWTRQQRLPTISLDELAVEISDHSSIRVQANAPNPHNCTALELYTLAVITRVISPTRALEIGTFDGRSTLAIAMNTEGFVYTLNIPPTSDSHGSFDAQLSNKVASGARFLEHPAHDRIEQLWGDSRTFDFAPYDGMQLIFIDGAHDAPTVRQDTATALKLVDRDNGAIVWHDATLYGVGDVLPELVADGLPIYLIRGTDIGLLRWARGEPTKFSRATAASASVN